MKEGLQRALTICSSGSLLLLAGAMSSGACGLNSATITNLPPFAGSVYQVYGLNQQGQVAGYLFVSGVHGPHAFLYSDTGLTDLGTLGGANSFGYGINDAGQVVGQADLSLLGQSHAFLYNGSMKDLGTLGGTSSSAAAINNSGQIVGESSLSGGTGPVAFLYANNAMTSLGTLGGTYSSAFALNDSGTIVGESYVANGDTHGFLWANGTMMDLGTLGGNYSSAFAINPTGVTVGESAVANGDVHAFVYSAGVMNDLGTLGGTYSSAFAVNTNGQVVGNGTLAGEQLSHGFFYDSGTRTDLGTLGGGNSSIWALNNLGQVVGDADLADGSTHAFLWATNQMLDLNTLLPANSGWELVSAQFINDAGRIVGYGTYGGKTQWFVMDLAKGNASPVANAGPNQVVDCQAQVTLDGSGSSDPDNDALTYSWTLGSNLLGMGATLAVSLPLGTNVVTLTVADACGASSSTNVVVTVVDTTPPTGSCPNAITASSDANCQAAVPNLVPQVVASDNCTPKDSLVITQDPAAGTMVNSGTHSITLTVTDSSGNHSSCTVPFTVVDTTAPTILAAPVSVSASVGANCQASVPNVLPNVVATDNCTPANQLALTQTPAAGTPIGTGNYTIVVKAIDAAGNSSTANVALTVADTTAPTFVSAPKNVAVSVGMNCQGSVPNVLPNVVVADNCTPANQLVLSQTPVAGTPIGTGNYAIVVTATDAAGNSSTVNVALTVTDTTPPTILSVPASVTINTGTGCQALMTNVAPWVVVTDNCTPASQLVITQNPPVGASLAVGQYIVTVSVTDQAGNTTTTNFPLTVINTNPPIIQSVTASPNVLNPPNHQLVPVTVSALVSGGCSTSVTTKIISITSNEAIAQGDIQITGDMTALLAASRNPSGGGRVYTITVQSVDNSGNSSLGNVTVSVPQGNGNGSTFTAAVRKN